MRLLLAVLAAAHWLGTAAAADAPTPSRCTASRRCRPDFTHFPYVNPTAPKGGRLVQGVLGTFDSLNPFIVKGLRKGASRVQAIAT